MKLWIVGINVAKDPYDKTNNEWEFKGIFDSEEKAVAACETPRCFLGEVVLNEDTGMERSEFKGYFPLEDPNVDLREI